MYNAPKQATIDISLSIPSRPVVPEFVQLLDAIKPLLECSKIPSPAALREDTKYRDVTFLANQTGWDPDKITNLAVAFRLADLAATSVPGAKVRLLPFGLDRDVYVHVHVLMYICIMRNIANPHSCIGCFFG